MKKLLVLSIMLPLCLFANEKKVCHYDDSITSTKTDHLEQRLDLKSFWKDVHIGDHKYAIRELLIAKPKTFNDRMYLNLCHLYLAVSRGENERAKYFADIIFDSTVDVYLEN